MEEASELITNTDITIDRLAMIDKHNVCRRLNHSDTINNSNSRLGLMAGPLIRASTTAD